MLRNIFIILSCICLLFCSELSAKTKVKTKINKKTYALSKNKLTKKVLNKTTKKGLVKTVKKEEVQQQEEESQEDTTGQTEETQTGSGSPSTENPIEGQMTESKETSVTDQNGNTQKVTTIEYF